MNYEDGALLHRAQMWSEWAREYGIERDKHCVDSLHGRFVDCADIIDALRGRLADLVQDGN